MEEFLYFFVSYSRTKKEKENDIYFQKPENKKNWPECIYFIESYENKKYYYKKIFKVIKFSKEKKSSHYYFELIIDDDRYEISFKSRKNSYVYNVSLQVGKKLIIPTTNIDQNDIEYGEKIMLFIEALVKNGEKEKIEDLFKDTMYLYSKKTSFSLLIPLFIQIYRKKDLCSILLDKFKEMNGSSIYKEKNRDRKPYLKKYVSEFNEIASKAKQIISNHNYNKIQFYGIILCYLNFYNHDKFLSILNELFTKEPKNLYEILNIYNLHFLYPITQNCNFLNKFINYIIKTEDFSIFKERINYIKNIETLIEVLEKIKRKYI